jgi:hypothetical protein
MTTETTETTETTRTAGQRVGTAGRWRVTTETSTYLLDLDAGLATRAPTTRAAGGIPAMRRDNEPVRLHSVALAEVGEPLVLVLDAGGNGALTLRRSTPVRSIARQDGGGQAEGRAASWTSRPAK